MRRLVCMLMTAAALSGGACSDAVSSQAPAPPEQSGLPPSSSRQGKCTGPGSGIRLNGERP